MDFNALQQKLFALDPSDPKEDLAKMRAAAEGGGLGDIPATKDYVTESVNVAEGSMPLDLDLSSFAALAGVAITESQKTGSAGQAKANAPIPKAELGRTKHPLKDQLVGEADEDRITALERRIEALESMLSEGDGRKKGIHGKGHPMRKKQQAAIHAGESTKKNDTLSIKEQLMKALNDYK